MGRKPIRRPCGCRTSYQVGRNGKRYRSNHRTECPLNGVKGNHDKIIVNTKLIMKKNERKLLREARKLLNKNKMIEAFDISRYSFNIIPHNNPANMRYLRALNFSYVRLSPNCLICKAETVYSYDIKTNKVLCESCYCKKVIQ